jgi:hypothetical protein
MFPCVLSAGLAALALAVKAQALVTVSPTTTQYYLHDTYDSTNFFSKFRFFEVCFVPLLFSPCRALFQ